MEIKLNTGAWVLSMLSFGACQDEAPKYGEIPHQPRALKETTVRFEGSEYELCNLDLRQCLLPEIVDFDCQDPLSREAEQFKKQLLMISQESGKLLNQHEMLMPLNRALLKSIVDETTELRDSLKTFEQRLIGQEAFDDSTTPIFICGTGMFDGDWFGKDGPSNTEKIAHRIAFSNNVLLDAFIGMLDIEMRFERIVHLQAKPSDAEEDESISFHQSVIILQLNNLISDLDSNLNNYDVILDIYK